VIWSAELTVARDGSLQIGFGFGKYTNRNAVDAFTGVASGWVEVNSVRSEVAEDSWIAIQDKSWGIRPLV
jgi:hypothetical protein